jgi:hypothetical protein
VVKDRAKEAEGTFQANRKSILIQSIDDDYESYKEQISEDTLI